MATDTSVKYFNSAMVGAPTLSGTAGALISILDACLVNGFGAVTLSSLVVASNVATGTVSAGHNFSMVGATGPVVTIAGATPSSLNGEWRIASVPNSTTFTFATIGISDQTATGTITATRSPMGFSKVYSGTNKAVYRANAVTSTRLYLRVDDATDAQWAYLRGYETMSDVDTGTNPFPSSGEVYHYKSSAASSATRSWNLFGDGHFFHLSAQTDATNWPGAAGFGDLVSYNSADAYGCMIYGHSAKSATSTNMVNLSVADQAGQYIARAVSQIGTSTGFGKHSNPKMTSFGNSVNLLYPDAATNGLVVYPVEIWESNGITIRGKFPGIYCPMHHYTSLTHGGVYDGVSGLSSSRSIIIQACHTNNQYRVAIDITGPWR